MKNNCTNYTKEGCTIFNSNDELKQVNKKIAYLESKLKKLPSGLLICNCVKNHVQWYVSDRTERRYIRKCERKYAEDLAKKRYYQVQLAELTSKKRALEMYNREYSPEIVRGYRAQIDELLSPDNGFRELLMSSIFKDTEKIEKWKTASFNSNPLYPEKRTIKTDRGEYVRSKSEAIIANALYYHQIPYRYECALNLDGRVYYPDFTIMHPITKKIYYWEHFGMMDDSVYRSDAYHKIDIYGQHGIYLNVNLITTSEVKDNQVNSMLVDSLIVQYFEPDTMAGI